MRYRKLGSLGWGISEVGYGMWGIAGGPGGFSGADYETAPACLDYAVELGCNFFDTAQAYGRGISEEMLGALLRRHPDRKLYIATKIAPKNMEWPPRPDDTLDDVFPADYIRESVHQSLDRLGVPYIDLVQFHVWEDRWAGDQGWQDAVTALKREGVIGAVGISVNRWEPANCLAALDTQLIDVIQAIYNIFDRAPEDELLPRAQQDGIGIIARVPFDEGTLTGTLTMDSAWPEGDWRNTYFGPENLEPSVQRLQQLVAGAGPLLRTGDDEAGQRPGVRPDAAWRMSLPEVALRFILENPAVSTVIPGMRTQAHVAANLGVSDGKPLDPALLGELRRHRWDRVPGPWSG